MTEKIHSLTKERQRRKPRTVAESAKAATRLFPHNPDIKEPKAFASGKMDKLEEKRTDDDD